jgi:hypothetical protein
MKYLIIAILLIIPVLILSSHAAVAYAEGVTGLFSTFSLSENSGDIVGAEIHIVPNPKGYSAIVQASEGAPGFPEVITLSVRGNTIEFAIFPNSASGFPPGKYVGLITRKCLLLDGPTESFKKFEMPRKESYWQ